MKTPTADDLKARKGKLADLVAYFRTYPLEWIDVGRLASVAGFCAWRTRVSDARKLFEADGGRLEWNGDAKHSAYCYTPYVPLGREASDRVTQKSLPL